MFNKRNEKAVDNTDGIQDGSKPCRCYSKLLSV